MEDFITSVSSWLEDINSVYDEIKYKFWEFWGLNDPLQILSYRSYGNSNCLIVTGRVLQDEGITPARSGASLWENLLNMYRRFESDEVPDAKIKIEFQGQQQEAVTNKEGFFEAKIYLTNGMNSEQSPYSVFLELIEPKSPKKDVVRSTAEVFIPTSSTKFGIISDFDDTIVYSHIQEQLKMIWTVYFGNANTRSPFPGSAEFYQALKSGKTAQEGNLLFYVSGSAWNIYDVIEDFLDLQNFPKGAILLRDIELSLNELINFSRIEYKLNKIRPILEFYPHLPFILIGDSGQQDAEVYTQLVKEYSSRILAIYIRSVTQDEKRQKQLEQMAEEVQRLGSQLVIVSNTVDAAFHAHQQGWITTEASNRVKQASQEDAKIQGFPI